MATFSPDKEMAGKFYKETELAAGPALLSPEMAVLSTK